MLLVELGRAGLSRCRRPRWAARSGDPVLFVTAPTRSRSRRRKALRAPRGLRSTCSGRRSAISAQGARPRSTKLAAGARAGRRRGPGRERDRVRAVRRRQLRLEHQRSRPRLRDRQRRPPARRRRRGAAVGERHLGARCCSPTTPTRSPAALRGYLLDLKPGYVDDPTRAVYNHIWLIGDHVRDLGRLPGQVDDLAEVAPVSPAPERAGRAAVGGADRAGAEPAETRGPVRATEPMSERERPERLRRTADHGRGHPRAGRAGHAPLRTSDPQPDPAPDRGPLAGPPGPARGRAPDRAADELAATLRRPARAAVSRRRQPISTRRARARPGPARARGCRDGAAARADRGRLPRPARATSSSRPGPTQDLMVTRLVPAIYERYWRPALGRVVEGRHRARDGGGDPDRAPAARPRRGRRRARRRLRPGQLLPRVRPRGRPGGPRRRRSTRRGRCSSAGAEELRRAASAT